MHCNEPTTILALPAQLVRVWLIAVCYGYDSAPVVAIFAETAGPSVRSLHAGTKPRGCNSAVAKSRITIAWSSAEGVHTHVCTNDKGRT